LAPKFRFSDARVALVEGFNQSFRPPWNRRHLGKYHAFCRTFGRSSRRDRALLKPRARCTGSQV